MLAWNMQASPGGENNSFTSRRPVIRSHESSVILLRHDCSALLRTVEVRDGISLHFSHSLSYAYAVFFMDRGDLMLFAEVQGQQRLLSVQEGYELMVGAAK